MRSSAEAQRIRSKYRRLLLLGKLRLSVQEAQALVGPDCAYHLYFMEPGEGARPRRGPKPRRRKKAKPRPREQG